MLKRVLIFILLSLPAYAEPQHLTILHFNDFHGHLENAARISSVIKNIEKANLQKGWHTIVLNGGDLISGTPVSARFNGEAEIKFINEIGTDAIVVGNHDFDFGMDALLKNISATKFPTLAANIFKKGKLYPAQAGVLIFKDNCPTVAIFGLTHEETPTLTSPASVKGLKFGKVVRAAKKEMKRLEGISDIQIALTHIGVKNDIELAKEVSGIDAVIGGHDHVRPEEYCRDIKNVPVCQTPSYGTYVGAIDLEIDGKHVKTLNKTLIPINNKVPKDPAVSKMMRTYLDPVEKEMKETIGVARYDIAHDRNFKGTTPLGGIIAEAIKDYTSADIGLVNPGGIRRPIKKGLVTKGDIEEVLPFPNIVLKLEMSGQQITNLLNNSAKRGKMMQLSGIAPDAILDPQKKYTVSTIDFLVNGGDGITEFKKAKVVTNTGKYIKEIFIAYIKKEKEL